VLNAADDALQRGDLAAASQLYERVVNTPPAGETPQQTAALTGYAHFRAAVALLAAGDEGEAKSHVEALQSADPTAAFARLAAQLWDQYSMVGSVRGACAQVQPQIASQARAELQVLQGLGVRIDAQSICAVRT
jgi:tetratricopeptide (TPR) repeat protein